MAGHGGHQRFDQLIGLVYPASEGGAVDRHTASRKADALPVQGLVVAVLAHAHLSHQGRARQALGDRAAGDRCLEDAFALHASELRSHVADHLEVPGHVLQLFTDLLADLAQPAAAGAAAAGLARWPKPDAGWLKNLKGCPHTGLLDGSLRCSLGGCSGNAWRQYRDPLPAQGAGCQLLTPPETSRCHRRP